MATCSSFTSSTTATSNKTSSQQQSTTTTLAVAASSTLVTTSSSVATSANPNHPPTYVSSSPFIKIHNSNNAATNGHSTNNNTCAGRIYKQTKPPPIVHHVQPPVFTSNDSNSSSRFERNYSYIEAMKDVNGNVIPAAQLQLLNSSHPPVQQQSRTAPLPPTTTHLPNTIPIINHNHHHHNHHQHYHVPPPSSNTASSTTHGSVNNKIAHLIALNNANTNNAASSNSATSSASSTANSSSRTTASSTGSIISGAHSNPSNDAAVTANGSEKRQRRPGKSSNGAAEIEIKIKLNGSSNNTTAVVGSPSPLNGSNLAKSRSQSSILSIFKNVSFASPFQIRKWKSKSKDKIDKIAVGSDPVVVATATTGSPSPPPSHNTVNSDNGAGTSLPIKLQQQKQPTKSTTNGHVSIITSHRKSHAPNGPPSGIPVGVKSSSAAVGGRPPRAEIITVINKEQHNHATTNNSNGFLNNQNGYKSVNFTPTKTTTSPTTSTSSTPVSVVTSSGSFKRQAPAAPFFLPNAALNFDSSALASMLSNTATPTRLHSAFNTPTPTSFTNLKPVEPQHQQQSVFYSSTVTTTPSHQTFTSSAATTRATSPNSPALPSTPRQLSYLKLACLVNGYDNTAKSGSTGNGDNDSLLRDKSLIDSLEAPTLPPQSLPIRNQTSSPETILTSVANTAVVDLAGVDLIVDDAVLDTVLVPANDVFETAASANGISLNVIDGCCVSSSEKEEVVVVVEMAEDTKEVVVETVIEILKENGATTTTTVTQTNGGDAPEPVIAADGSVNGSAPTITTETIKSTDLVINSDSNNTSSKNGPLPATKVKPTISSVVFKPPRVKKPLSIKYAENGVDIIYDGDHYTQLLEDNTNDINELCAQYEPYINQPEDSPTFIPNEEALGQVQTTVGKAQLLVNQKMKQFRDLCAKNIREKTDEPADGKFLTRDEDLAGFWDMVCLQIEDIKKMFANLDELKAQNWQMPEPVEPESKGPREIKLKPKVVTPAQKDAAKKRLEEAKATAASLKAHQNAVSTMSHPDIQHFKK